MDAVRADLWQRLTEAESQAPPSKGAPSLLEWATSHGERLVASTVAATAHNTEQAGARSRGPARPPVPRASQMVAA